jgi:hypothetical protein
MTRNDRFLDYFRTRSKLLRLYRMESDSEMIMNGGQIRLECGLSKPTWTYHRIHSERLRNPLKSLVLDQVIYIRFESGSSLIKVWRVAFECNDCEKPWKTSVKISSDPSQIWSGYIRHTG